MPGIARQNPTMRSSSYAPNACPPILLAVTNKRTGSRSTSSNPQIGFCSFTASTNSGCVVQRVDFNHSFFGFLPQGFHFFDGRVLGRLSPRRQPFFHMREPAAEFRIGVAQSLFRIHLQKARDVDDDEQNVAELVLPLRRLSLRGLQFARASSSSLSNTCRYFPNRTRRRLPGTRSAAPRPAREWIAKRR